MGRAGGLKSKVFPRQQKESRLNPRWSKSAKNAPLVQAHIVSVCLMQKSSTLSEMQSARFFVCEPSTVLGENFTVWTSVINSEFAPDLNTYSSPLI